MEKYLEIFIESTKSYASYFVDEISLPSAKNYFYMLLFISLLFWVAEIVFPWRKNQNTIRKDFWLDGFYMFFNFFVFNLIGFYALTEVFSELFNDFLGLFNVNNLVAIQLKSLPKIGQWLIYFAVRDFLQWWIHRLLHKSDFLWNFHKVHHSVEEMGFAAHLRFHWGETIVYRTLEFVPLSMIGYGIDDFFVVHTFATLWGHYNHSNIKIPIGYLKYIFNNPQMHMWHHAKKLPVKTGVNFGLTLSIWDFIFKTNYQPNDGRDIELGFEPDEDFPKDFLHQIIYPLNKKKEQT